LKRSRENIGILALGLVWLGSRILVSKVVSPETGFQVGAFANLLILLLVIYWALRDTYGTQLPSESHFLVDLKNTLRAGSKYMILVSALIFVNYAFLEADFLAKKVADQMQESADWLNEDANYQQLLVESPQLKDKSKEELLQMKKEQVEMFNSAHTQTLFSLMALMFMNVFYAFIMVLLFRKVLYRQKTHPLS